MSRIKIGQAVLAITCTAWARIHRWRADRYPRDEQQYIAVYSRCYTRMLGLFRAGHPRVGAHSKIPLHLCRATVRHAYGAARQHQQQGGT